MPRVYLPLGRPFEEGLDDAVKRIPSGAGAAELLLPPGEILLSARERYGKTAPCGVPLRITGYEEAASRYGAKGVPKGLTKATGCDVLQAARALLEKAGAGERELPGYLRLAARCERLFGAREAAADALEPFAAQDKQLLRLTLLCRFLDAVLEDVGVISAGRLFHLTVQAWTQGEGARPDEGVHFIAALLPDSEDVRAERAAAYCARHGETLIAAAPESPALFGSPSGAALRVLLQRDPDFLALNRSAPAPAEWTVTEHAHLQIEAERCALALADASAKGARAALTTKDRRLAAMIEAALQSLQTPFVSGFSGSPKAAQADRALGLCAAWFAGTAPAEDLPSLTDSPFIAFGVDDEARRERLTRALRQAISRLRCGAAGRPPLFAPSPEEILADPGLPAEARAEAAAFFARGRALAALPARAPLFLFIEAWRAVLPQLCADPEDAEKILACLAKAPPDAALYAVPAGPEAAAMLLRTAAREAFPEEPFRRADGAVSVAPPEKLRLLTFDLLILAGRTEDEEDGAADAAFDLPDPLQPERCGGETAALLSGARRAVFSWSRERFGARRRPCRFLRRALLLAPPPAGAERKAPSPWRPPYNMNAAKPPAPAPAAALRPAVLAATTAETLMRNPYRFYALQILKLRPQEPAQEEFSAREHGVALHAAAERLAAAYREQGAVPEEGALQAALAEAAAEKFGRRASPVRRAFWAALAGRTAARLAALEEDARRRGAVCSAEEMFSCYLECAPSDFDRRRGAGVTLRARIDRLEEAPGEAHVVDFKTGGVPSRSEWRNGLRAQLPVTLMVYAENRPKESYRLSAVQPSAARGRGVTAEGADAEAVLTAARLGARRLAERYLTGDAPFLYLPAENDPEDYAFLARYAEWRYNQK